MKVLITHYNIICRYWIFSTWPTFWHVWPKISYICVAYGKM